MVWRLENSTSTDTRVLKPGIISAANCVSRRDLCMHERVSPCNERKRKTMNAHQCLRCILGKCAGANVCECFAMHLQVQILICLCVCPCCVCALLYIQLCLSVHLSLHVCVPPQLSLGVQGLSNEVLSGMQGHKKAQTQAT